MTGNTLVNFYEKELFLFGLNVISALFDVQHSIFRHVIVKVVLPKTSVPFI